MISCDAIKIAYRQSKEGFVVSFAIHPQDMPVDLANADIGSQWQLKLVPLDENGNAEQSPTREAEASVVTSASPPRKFNTLPLSQQAALLCQDQRFLAFMREELKLDCRNSREAAAHMHDRYAVISRSELKPETDAGQEFIQDRERFLAWKLVAA